MSTITKSKKTSTNKKHSVYVVWGTDATRNFNNNGKISMNHDDIDGCVNFYSFDTQAELNAFLKGINEANGWFDSAVILSKNAKIVDNNLVLVP
jgi:hypothetical protein